MKRRIRTTFLRHPVIGATLALIVACVWTLLVVQVAGWLRWELFARRIEFASADRGAFSSGQPVVYASWAFAYRNKAVRLRVAVPVSELRASETVDTGAMFRATGALRAHYVSRAVAAQSTSGFVAALAGQLRSVRYERGLDDDEYLELLARAVQSLRHGTVGSRVRLPVEVAVSGVGVCSEKSLLLAALMLHEGYETGMWVFDSLNHVSIAVASDGARFRGRYAFIETTRLAYVGQVASAYRANGPVARPPQFIGFGGHTSYHSGRQVEYILARLSEAVKQSEAVEGSTRHGERSFALWVPTDARATTRQYDARRVANYIRGQSDERKSLFERLTHSTAEAARSAPPALMY